MSDDRRRGFLRDAAVRARDFFNIPGRLLKKAVRNAPAIEDNAFQQPEYSVEPTTGHETALATVPWPTRFWS
jgi:hypothetical protein